MWVLLPQILGDHDIVDKARNVFKKYTINSTFNL